MRRVGDSFPRTFQAACALSPSLIERIRSRPKDDFSGGYQILNGELMDGCGKGCGVTCPH